MQEKTKVNPIQTAEPQDDNLRIAFKEALAISNRHKGVRCIAVSEYSAKCLSRRAGWGIYSLMALVISSRLRAFEHMWFEFTYAFPVFRLLEVFRTLHVEHHKHLGDPVRDSDVVRLIDYGFISDTPMSASRKTWLIFGLPWTGWFQYEYINTLFIEFWMDSSCYPSKLIYWIVVLSAVHFSDRWTEFGWYYVVPWLGSSPSHADTYFQMEHLGMDMTKDFGNSRTNDGFWQRWFFYPLNDGLHAARHLNGQVPCYRLRRAQAELMAESTAFREKNVIVNSMWETYSQVYTRPTIIKERLEGVRAEGNNGH
ncbi:hypothetical protein FB451DRAFT_1301543 [Mycena latifolia]|nr:hypothetical protein FB451DRAFT_1301543 [Mycena latifolia]